MQNFCRFLFSSIKRTQRNTGITALLLTVPLLSNPVEVDVVVYGATSAGVVAAVQTVKSGKSVALINVGKHIGGLTSGGLGLVDAGETSSVGGISRDFFHRVWKHYQKPESWKYESKSEIKGQHGKLKADEKTTWVVEPSVAGSIFNEMLQENNVHVHLNERLDRKTGVTKTQNAITEIRMESGLTFRGKMFIDATYEGDLMAASGVSYFVGRESNSQYQETLNGIRFNKNLYIKVDPYIRIGDPSSGLLPRIVSTVTGVEGDGDKGVQAYCYRMCLTDYPENRIKVEKPEGYQEIDFEMMIRAIEAGSKAKVFFKLSQLPNRKTDSNNNGFASTDFVGMNWDYAEADYATRKRIDKAHENYQRGIIWTLQNNPRVTPEVREYYKSWGLPKDEFVDNDHWSPQLYVREARRMVGSYVVTEHTAMGKDSINDSVGLGSYHMDSHCVQLYVGSDGFIKQEGGMFSKIPAPFPISYRAIVPKESECTNILVPICLSATHAAYGSIRMEPVFMILAESAATAAAIAIDEKCTIQNVPYEKLRKALFNQKQILEFSDKKEKK